MGRAHRSIAPPCDVVGGRQGAADSVSADAHEVPMSECEALFIGIPWAGRIGVSPFLVMWLALKVTHFKVTDKLLDSPFI